MICCRIDTNRAPQSATTAKSVQQAVNEVLSGEPGYRAATDAEFEDLLWAGCSNSGAEVRGQCGSSASPRCVFAHTLHPDVKMETLAHCSTAPSTLPTAAS